MYIQVRFWRNVDHHAEQPRRRSQQHAHRHHHVVRARHQQLVDLRRLQCLQRGEQCRHRGGSDIVTWDNGDVDIAWARPIYGSAQPSPRAGPLWYSGGSEHARHRHRLPDWPLPSMEIDKDGALHIAYIDRDNTRLRYATNATKRGVGASTLDESSPNPNNDGCAQAWCSHQGSRPHHSSRAGERRVDAQPHHQRLGRFVSTTITNTSGRWKFACWRCR